MTVLAVCEEFGRARGGRGRRISSTASPKADDTLEGALCPDERWPRECDGPAEDGLGDPVLLIMAIVSSTSNADRLARSTVYLTATTPNGRQ